MNWYVIIRCLTLFRMLFKLNEPSKSIKSNGKMGNTHTSISVKLETTLIDILTRISVSTSFEAVF